MKIAIMADRLVMGGLETHIVTSVNELLRRGDRILLNTAYTDPAILSQIEDPGGGFAHREWSSDPGADLREFNPDVIHAHPFTAIFRGYDAAQTLGKPFFVTMHGLYDFGLDRSPLGTQVCARVNAIIAVDHGVANLLSGCVAHPEKITVIYNGIDTGKFRPYPLILRDRANFGLEAHWPTLVVVSRLADGKEKTVIRLLNCASQLGRELGGLNILIVGGGDWYSSVRAISDSLNGQPLLKIGMVGPSTDVVGFLAMADLVLACDRAAMEAMACQRAVLAINAAGFGEVIRADNFKSLLLNRSGYIEIPEREVIHKIAGLMRDPQSRQRLALEGLEIVTRNFNITQTVSQLESVYNHGLK
jgi:glycosyltransferase involved in cell wall biosynthesis